MRRIFLATVVAATGLHFTSLRGECAGLISSISYDQVVSASYAAIGGNPEQVAHLTGATIPVSAIKSVSSDGASATANYSFTDDGYTATLRIDTSFSAPSGYYDPFWGALGAGGGVENNGSNPMTIIFSQPVTFIATITNTAIGGKVRVACGGYLQNPVRPSEGFNGGFGGNASGANPSVTSLPKSGLLSGVGTYSLGETTSLSSSFSDGSGTAGTGTGFFQITFTAVSGPTLAIAPGNGTVTLQWPSSASAYGLERAIDLQNAGWNTVTNSPTVIGGTNYSVTLPADSTQQFFRLHHS